MKELQKLLGKLKWLCRGKSELLEHLRYCGVTEEIPCNEDLVELLYRAYDVARNQGGCSYVESNLECMIRMTDREIKDKKLITEFNRLKRKLEKVNIKLVNTHVTGTSRGECVGPNEIHVDVKAFELRGGVEELRRVVVHELVHVLIFRFTDDVWLHYAWDGVLKMKKLKQLMPKFRATLKSWKIMEAEEIDKHIDYYIDL